jgi:hypothetical protein
MPCHPVKLFDGSTAIVCSRGSTRKRCAYCGRASDRLCDFPVLRDGKRTTCDAALCSRCTTRITGDRDLCRSHVACWNHELGRPLVGPGAEER